MEFYGTFSSFYSSIPSPLTMAKPLYLPFLSAALLVVTLSCFFAVIRQKHKKRVIAKIKKRTISFQQRYSRYTLSLYSVYVVLKSNEKICFNAVPPGDVRLRIKCSGLDPWQHSVCMFCSSARHFTLTVPRSLQAAVDERVDKTLSTTYS